MGNGSSSASAQQDPLAPSSPGPALRAGEAPSEAIGHTPWPMGAVGLSGLPLAEGKAGRPRQGAVAAVYECLIRALALTFSMKGRDVQGGGLALPVAAPAAVAAAMAAAVAAAAAAAAAVPMAVAVAGPLLDIGMAVSVPWQMRLSGGSRGALGSSGELWGALGGSGHGCGSSDRARA
jgi:hypothetical protein